MSKAVWRVTVYNQHAGCGIFAEASTRPKAFRMALAKAGEEFLRYGGDKLTALRSLFFDQSAIRGANRDKHHLHLKSPAGCAVEWRLMVDRDGNPVAW